MKRRIRDRPWVYYTLASNKLDTEIFMIASVCRFCTFKDLCAFSGHECLEGAHEHGRRQLLTLDKCALLKLIQSQYRPVLPSLLDPLIQLIAPFGWCVPVDPDLTTRLHLEGRQSSQPSHTQSMHPTICINLPDSRYLVSAR